MKKILLSFFILLFYSILGYSQNWETFYEKSGFKETPRYDKTIRYCRQLENASPMVHYTGFGMSPQGRELPLLIIDKKGNFDPASVKASKNAVVLIQACIHAGECDGKDAGLMLARDLAIYNKYPELLDNITILFIPIYNVDGHERFGAYNRINQNGPSEGGWRTNANNLNLNRDYLKADAPETRAWLSLFNEWEPDFFIDCHTTDGADYQYVLTYGLEIFGNTELAITSWMKDHYLKDIEARMNSLKLPIFPYIEFRNWHDPRSGIEAGVAPPMLSQGYTALRNIPGLLIETHMLKDYRTRVNATYEMVRNTLEIIKDDKKNLCALIDKANTDITSPEFRKTPLPVDFEVSQKDSVMVDFLGFDYTMEKSDLTGGNWFKYGNKPTTFKVPYFNTFRTKDKVELPEAYIIAPEWKEVADRIKAHGIRFSLLERETKFRVKSYRFKNVKYPQKSYEGRQTISYDLDPLDEERMYPAGSMIIDMDQPLSKVIAYLLEPQASTSLAYWGFFNAILEQKEYAESYVMEKLAREMMEKDPNLKAEFEKKKADDPKFAASSWDMLNWFYSKTPYWDQKKDVYPVGKIFDRRLLPVNQK
jgi:hypothetical protein